MRGNRVQIGFMLSIVFQIIGILAFLVYGRSFVSITIFLLGSLIGMVASVETRKVDASHIYAMISTLAGLIVLGLSAIFVIIEIVYLLLLVNYVICFFTLALTRHRRRKVPARLPSTSKDKIKVGDEVENIFRELEKEVKKSKKKTRKKKVKKKSTGKKTARKTARKKQRYSAIGEGKTFHLPTCGILLRQDSKKYVHFGTRQQALSKGRRPCRVCNP